MNASRSAGRADLDARVDELIAELDGSNSRDDLQDVGRRSRETLIDCAQLLADPSLVSAGQAPPKAADAKAWLELLPAARASGSHRDALRRLIRAAWDLAQTVTRGNTDGRPVLETSDALIPSSATIGDILLAAMNGNPAKISARQRARWAIGQTEWVNVTHDILPAVAVAAVTYLVTLATAPKGTPIDKWVVGAPLVAGVVALVVVYLVLNLIEVTVNYSKAGPQLRKEEEQRRQDSLIKGAEDSTMTAWLRQQLARPEFHIRFAAAFGSVTKTYPTRDVDVVVQLEPGSDDRDRTAGLRVKALARTFTAEFQLPLHLQLFSSTETDRLLKFALRAGSLDVLIGADY
jgi:hypothetical protein